jgi:glycine C-acetyltransferase/8-amino-7-oxononanoate synthase
MIELEARLEELRSLGLDQSVRLVSGPQGPHVLLDGRPVLLLCSSNYLGLADHPRVREAAAEAAMRWGVGAGGSRLVCGTMTIHRRLEERLAQFMGRESALLFGSGYLAGAGTVAALARPGDVVFCDELSHPSLIDGGRLSGAEVFVYDHCDVEHLAWGLTEAEGRGALIVTDSVFSVDGQVAPLAEIVELGQRSGVRLLVDEAHAVGVLGPEGRGALAEAGLADQVDVIIGSMGNALGSYGAFAACEKTMARHLMTAAHTFGLSAAPAPPAVAAALAALDLVAPRRLARLTENAAALRRELELQGFDVGDSQTQIVAPAITEAALAKRICEAAVRQGVFAGAVGPSTVPATDPRLRLTVMATHRPPELRAAARTLGQAARAAGISQRLPPPLVGPANAGRAGGRSERATAPFDFEAPEAPEPARRAA